jgi:hypothetical protein
MSKKLDSIQNTTNADVRTPYIKPNIPLMIFDMLLLPVHIVRMMLIYVGGSKYNIPGFQFLDVIMHADSPYFNQEDCKAIDTLTGDYRIVIREDSRMFATDFNNLVSSFKILETNNCGQSEKSPLCTIPNISDNTSNLKNTSSDNINVFVGYTGKKVKADWDIESVDNESVDNGLVDNNVSDDETDDIDSNETDNTNDDDSDDTNTIEHSSVNLNTKPKVIKKKTIKDLSSLSESLSSEYLSSESSSSEQTRSKHNMKVKGVDYFESNEDDKDKKKKANITSNVLDSIKQELDSAFDD